MSPYRKPRVGQLATMTVGPTCYPVTIVGVRRATGRVTIWVRESDCGRVSMWRRRTGGRYVAHGVADADGSYFVRLGQ